MGLGTTPVRGRFGGGRRRLESWPVADFEEGQEPHGGTQPPSWHLARPKGVRPLLPMGPSGKFRSCEIAHSTKPHRKVSSLLNADFLK